MGLLLKAYWKELLAVGLALLLTYIVYDHGYESGVNATLVAQQKANAATQKRYDALETQYNKAVDSTQKAITEYLRQIDESYLKGLEDGRKSPQDTIDELANNNRRLSIELKRAKAANTCGTGNSTSSGVDDDTERAELSDRAARFLIAQADRADDVTKQLGACQATVKVYYSKLTDLRLMIENMQKNKE